MLKVGLGGHEGHSQRGYEYISLTDKTLSSSYRLTTISPSSCQHLFMACFTSSPHNAQGRARANLLLICWLHFGRVTGERGLHDVLHDQLMCRRRLFAPLLLHSIYGNEVADEQEDIDRFTDKQQGSNLCNRGKKLLLFGLSTSQGRDTAHGTARINLY